MEEFKATITAGTDPVEPRKCRGFKVCKRYLVNGWGLPYCRRCHSLHVQRGREIKEARKFPGVDIDAIHYKLGAVRGKK